MGKSFSWDFCQLLSFSQTTTDINLSFSGARGLHGSVKNFALVTPLAKKMIVLLCDIKIAYLEIDSILQKMTHGFFSQ